MTCKATYRIQKQIYLLTSPLCNPLFLTPLWRCTVVSLTTLPWSRNCWSSQSKGWCVLESTQCPAPQQTRQDKLGKAVSISHLGHQKMLSENQGSLPNVQCASHTHEVELSFYYKIMQCWVLEPQNEHAFFTVITSFIL